MADASTLLALQKDQATKNASASAAQTDLYNLIGTTYVEVSDAIKTRGASEQLVKAAEDQAALDTQARKSRAAAIYGVDVNAQGEVLSALAAQSQEAFNEKLAALERVKQKQSVNLFDDPLGWIVNRFTINEDIDAHNNAALKQEALDSRTKELNNMFQEAAITSEQLKANVTEITKRANADRIAASTTILLQEAARAGLQNNLSAIETTLKMDDRQLALATNEYHIRAQQEQRALALRQLTMHEQEFAWKKEAKETDDAYNERIIGQYNRGLMVMHGKDAKPIEPTSKEAKALALSLRSGQMTGKRDAIIFHAGESGIIAPNVAGTLNALSQDGAIKFEPGQELMRNLLRKVEEDFSKSAFAQGQDLKDPKVRASVQQQYAQWLLDEDLKDLSRSKFLRVPTVKATLENMPQLASRKAIASIVMPMISAGLSPSPEQIFAATAKAIEDKKISYTDALDVSMLFGAQAQLAVASANPTRFGLVAKEEAMGTYKAQINTNAGALFSGTEAVALSNPTELSSAISKYLWTKRGQKFEVHGGMVMSPEELFK